MKKVLLDFHGEYQTSDYEYHYISLQLHQNQPYDLVKEVCRAIDQVRSIILNARKENSLVTIALPDHGVAAAALIQGIRGLTGHVLFTVVKTPEGIKEVDIEEVREIMRDTLTVAERD
ncbi:hypothetical protein [Risungbinella massiliensis]|uniref:hypothetical protein n=1 Tax=Risungbinella massiliensis TaxID=1329796 RepID=UPI0005CBB66E|nr:hypothetical protein [Risungbinella massiliensis]